jgi:class 3 adenylate cyclase
MARELNPGGRDGPGPELASAGLSVARLTAWGRVLRELLPGISAVSAGLLTGAMLFIGLSVVPWLRSLPPADFHAWIWSYGPAMRQVMRPMSALSTLLALAALAVSRGSSTTCRRLLLAAAACLVAVSLLPVVWGQPVSATLAASGMMSRGEEVALLDREMFWDWLRIIPGLAAFLTTLSALKLREKELEERAQHDRLERLKRFFSPHLADLIARGGSEDPLQSHRREVTVVFLDLRGFSLFAETAEPEEVMAVLHEYHAEVGRLVLEWEGTLERFTGDGMMIFFNDPVPMPNASEHAVRMAVAIRARIEEVRAGWQKRGFELDLGVGIAQGFATIGAIGFEGRWDYGVIGTVTNLSARLCAEALPGQILVSTRVLVDTEDFVEAEPMGELQLKGFSKSVPAFNVIRLAARRLPPMDLVGDSRAGSGADRVKSSRYWYFLHSGRASKQSGAVALLRSGRHVHQRIAGGLALRGNLPGN